MGATWKRQQSAVSGYKFGDLDIKEFYTGNFLARLQYLMPFGQALKSVFVYFADISILILTFLALFEKCDNNSTSPTVQIPGSDIQVSPTSSACQEAGRSTIFLPLIARPWIILASVGLSFLLLFLDWRKAWAIIQSGDIAYAFTSNIASRYYMLKSYSYFCFFLKVKNQRNWVDKLAFHVFFVFKGWKRLLLAEFPRQFINALLIFDAIDPLTRKGKNVTTTRLFDDPYGFGLLFGAYNDIFTKKGLGYTTSKKFTLALQTITVLLWIFSLANLIVAFAIYLPLLSSIKGNLKEYCCHKIDLRLEELLRKNMRKKAERSRADSDYDGGSQISHTSSSRTPRTAAYAYQDYPPPPQSYAGSEYGGGGGGYGGGGYTAGYGAYAGSEYGGGGGYANNNPRFYPVAQSDAGYQDYQSSAGYEPRQRQYDNRKPFSESASYGGYGGRSTPTDTTYVPSPRQNHYDDYDQSRYGPPQHQQQQQYYYQH